MRKWGMALTLVAQGAAAEPMCLTPLEGGGVGEGVVAKPPTSDVGIDVATVPGHEALYVDMGVWGSTGRVEDGRIAPITEGPFEHRAADDQVIIRRDGRVQVLGGRFDSLYTHDPEADAFDRGPVGIGDRNA